MIPRSAPATGRARASGLSYPASPRPGARGKESKVRFARHHFVGAGPSFDESRRTSGSPICSAATDDIMRLRSAFAALLIAGPLLGAAVIGAAAPAQRDPVWGSWTSWGDQGDGSYRNPIAPADYSDIDAIRVGDDYFAITSTIHVSPGMGVMHSKDLVNWRMIGHVVPDLTTLGSRYSWDKPPTPGRGVWAGSIRYRAGKFRVFFGTPDEGVFMSSAAVPAGPWTAPHLLLAEPGWDDPAVLWDDDGQAYLLATKFSDGYKSYIWRMSPDGRTIDRENGVLVNQGGGREASKLLKVDGWYYLIFSESGQGAERGRNVLAKRARSPMGPYSEAHQLAEAGRAAFEPNQGGLLKAHDGNWYFLTHHGRQDWEGRAMSLLPVQWIDGWPIIGTLRANGVGSMTWAGPKPRPGYKTASRHFVDDFDRGKLLAEWEWTRNPRSDKWSLKERPGWLRLHAWRPAGSGDPLSAGNTLTQRAWRTSNAHMTVKVDLAGMADGQRAGLGHFSDVYAILGVHQESGVRQLEYQRAGAPKRIGPSLHGRDLWLRINWGLKGETRFSYSLNGREFAPFGEVSQQTRASYRGSRIGMVSFNDSVDRGYLDVDRVVYDYSR